MTKLTAIAFSLMMFAIGGVSGLSMKSGSVLEYLAEGSLRGLNACLSNSSSIALANDQIRNVCASKHAVNLNRRMSIEGLGAPQESTRGRFIFAGSIINTNANYLVTFVQVSLTVYDDQGESSTHEAFGNVWATPFEETPVELPFSRQLSEEILQVSWCDKDTSEDELTSCRTWEITQVAGVPT